MNPPKILAHKFKKSNQVNNKNNQQLNVVQLNLKSKKKFLINQEDLKVQMDLVLLLFITERRKKIHKIIKNYLLKSYL
jgi:hypothetical protein